MTPDIPLLGVLVAAVSAFVVGGIWYGPKTFYQRWRSITGTPEEHVKAYFAKSLLWHAVSALIMAYVLAHFIGYTMVATEVDALSAGIVTGFWGWLGFSLTTLISSNALDHRDKFLIVIQGGDRLVTLLLMGAILGAFM